MENPFEALYLLLREVRDKQDKLEAKIDSIGKADQADELVTREQKAKDLKVSLATLLNWEKDGILTPVRKGRRVYFYKSENHPKKHL